MSVQDVSILTSRASFSTTFLKNCSRGETLGTTTRLIAVVCVGIGMLSVKYFCSNKASVLCRSYFKEII